MGDYSNDTVQFWHVRHFGWAGTNVTITSRASDQMPTYQMVPAVQLGGWVGG